MHLRRIVSLVASLLAVVVVLAVAPAAAAATTSNASDTALGRRLVDRFMTMLEHKDVAGLRALLAPEFQIVRSNGISATRAEYLAHLPEVSSFRQSDFVVTRHGDSLVVRNNAIVDVVVDGQQSAGTSSPRLSTFRKDPRTGTWRMVAHGNFVPFS